MAFGKVPGNCSEMLIEIDEGSGFCFGVTTAIKKAEEELAKSDSLYCLGDIVHNGREVERLKKMGLTTVEHADLDSLHDIKMLLRAHGEPPQTYMKAKEQNIRVIDATCPVVLNLQKRIRKAYEAGGQIVIYGKNGHAEVVGLVGQTDGTAIVIENLSEIDTLDFSHHIELFSQTTKDPAEYEALKAACLERSSDITIHDMNLMKRMLKTYLQQIYHGRVAYPKRNA